MYDVIYLIPDDEHGFLWCTDPAPGVGMEESDAVKYIRADLVGAQEPSLQADCEHVWVSMENEVIAGGEMCTKCHAVRATA